LAAIARNLIAEPNRRKQIQVSDERSLDVAEKRWEIHLAALTLDNGPLRLRG